MSTIIHTPPRSLGLNTTQANRDNHTPAEGGRQLAALLLAAAVAALVVLADQLIETWVDGHLFLGWVALWVVIFAGSVLLAGSARQAAARMMAVLDAWSRSMAESRAEARMEELARRDPRLQAELNLARTREQSVDAAVSASPAATVAYAEALAPLDMTCDHASPAIVRRMAQMAMRRNAGYLPYL